MHFIDEKRFHQIIEEIPKVAPILVVGDVGIDKYTYGSVERISPEAPVPILQVEEEWYTLGLAANVANNLMALKVKPILCSVIGDDRHGSHFESLLEDNKILTWGLIREKGRPTTLKERIITKVQQICRVDYESLGKIRPETEERLLVRTSELGVDGRYLILEDYGKGLITESLCEGLKSQGLFVAVDPSRTTPPLYYKNCDLLKPNLAEARLMARTLGYSGTDLQSIADVLIEKLHIKKLVITLGPEGMAFLDTQDPKSTGKLTILPTLATEVFDVSGAGDTAISAITISLAAGATLEEATWMGNCASGIVVGKKGTATITLEELEKFYGNLKAFLEQGQGL